MTPFNSTILARRSFLRLEASFSATHERKQNKNKDGEMVSSRATKREELAPKEQGRRER